MSNNRSTVSVHAGEEKNKPYHSLTTPMVLSSTYPFTDTSDLLAYKSSAEDDPLQERQEYGRYGNPTVQAAERKIAALDSGECALLFSSGMNAITSTLMTLLSSGDHLVMVCPVYRRTRDFCSFLQRWGIETSFTDSNDFEEIQAAIRPNTRVLFAETPSNPTLRVVDLEKTVSITSPRGILTIIDSTFGTPINVQPLRLGVDLVIHSATKYLGGHNDLLAGAVIGSRTILNDLKNTRDVLGGVLSPMDAYLLLRGLKTLSLRVEKQNRNGQLVAEYLEKHPHVNRVHYPGLPSHPDHEIASRLMTGFGGVVSFEVSGSLEDTSMVIDRLQLPYIGPTLGGVESIAQQQALLVSTDPEERRASGIPDQLIRYALGIEDADDILADLEQALQIVGKQEPDA